MLADFFSDTVVNLEQLILPVLRIGVPKESIAVNWANVPEHGTSEIFDVVALEQLVPAATPVVMGGIERRDIEILCVACRWAAAACDPTVSHLLQRHGSSIAMQKPVSPVLFVCENSTWSLFAESCCYC